MPVNHARGRTLGLLAIPAAALGLVLGTAVAASAATVNPVNTTYDRPGITLVPGGDFEVTWAGTDANGEVNGALLNPDGTIVSGTKWTDSSSATYQGTGTAVAFDAGLDFSLMAWTDLGKTVHVALDNHGASCESTAGFGTSVDTPYLTLAADVPRHRAGDRDPPRRLVQHLHQQRRVHQRRSGRHLRPSHNLVRLPLR
jgi:hypothetical protein